jgi:hypothetical protein
LADVEEHFAGVCEVLEGVSGFFAVLLCLRLDWGEEAAGLFFEPGFEFGAGEGLGQRVFTGKGLGVSCIYRLCHFGCLVWWVSGLFFIFLLADGVFACLLWLLPILLLSGVVDLSGEAN